MNLKEISLKELDNENLLDLFQDIVECNCYCPTKCFHRTRKHSWTVYQLYNELYSRLEKKLNAI